MFVCAEQHFSDVNRWLRDHLRPRRSHNYEHAIKATRLSFTILTMIPWFRHSPTLFEDTIGVYLVTMIHDVLDEKYKDCTRDALLKVLSKNRLLKNFGGFFINKIIDASCLVSFSAENKLTESGKHVVLELNTEDGKSTNFNFAFYRDVASDADKLCSLYETGFDAFLSFIDERITPDTAALTPSSTPPFVRMCSCARMLKLKDQYIKTMPGKRMAVAAHEGYLIALNKYLERHGEELVVEKPTMELVEKPTIMTAELNSMFECLGLVVTPHEDPTKLDGPELNYLLTLLRHKAQENQAHEEFLQRFLEKLFREIAYL